MGDDATSKKSDPTEAAFCEALEFLEKEARKTAENNLDKGNIAAVPDDIERIKRAENLLYKAGCSGGEHLPSGTSVPPGQGPSGLPSHTGKGGPG
jgi:hypothetical protein